MGTAAAAVFGLLPSPLAALPVVWAPVVSAAPSLTAALFTSVSPSSSPMLPLVPTWSAGPTGLLEGWASGIIPSGDDACCNPNLLSRDAKISHYSQNGTF